MGNLILMVFVLLYLPTELLAIQVNVPQTERRTMLFASVIIRCDYTTSANQRDVMVTWKYKSFCKDPILDYYSTAYQAVLNLGQDPTNDCSDSQRIVRVVIQKRGVNEPTLSADYRNRKITIRNNADLVINEVMWWDNGMYFCTIDATGDTVGDSDREVRLIVFHWLTVLLIIIGFILLLMLFCICCCQCCPHKCCCYVRCPCCPRTCCCPEKAVMRHRMVKEAEKAMAPWMNGQPIYTSIHSNASSQGVPLIYSGSVTDYPTKQNFAMSPVQLLPMALQQPLPPQQQYVHSSLHGSTKGNSNMLDYLENQVRGLDVGFPQMAPQAVQAMHLQSHVPPQPSPPAVPYAPGPPSMLSALDEIGVKGEDRRVITLPPIIQRAPSFPSRRGPSGGDGARGYPRMSSHSSGSTNRSGGGVHRDGRGYRDASPPRQGILRDYSDDSDWDNRRGRAAHKGSRYERASSGGRGGGSRPRTKFRDDLMEEVHAKAGRRERSYSPPPHRKGSWSSDDEDSEKRKGGKGKEWPEKPPSYFSIQPQQGRSNGRRNYDRFSDRSSHSSTSVVI
ncbi:immunoglobulin-like domain-containing receptor 1 [Nothobranchius furzeri]|uniref:Immunoglobulin-like domain containing receptor 1b n=1 Tax=Nothobranchius furzeri TaxID=105023 RepID=A0A8C6PKN0_NOTFU|nr:immunoglobulin-like domain-containing receptor 1b [Nothobranchius furzeri]KAF7215609.1 immunoglobulin-like domain-containing receptor 1 [Nothobranchius furzeri]